MAEQVYIFDTTLRDGEQSPGASMTTDEKIRMALQLERLGVDVIEAGFPIASPGEFESVQKIASSLKNVTVAGLARANKADIDAAWNAIKVAAHPRLHIFIATSDIHLKYKLKRTREQVLEDAVGAVKHALQFTGDVEFSAEDATRSDIDYLCQIVKAVIEAGASVVNLPDTVGYSIPAEIGALFRKIRENVPNIDRVILSTHCHNDLGMAVANSLAAVRFGARQVECTVNGIGERAGNASLEEIVMAIRTREDQLPFHTNISSREIYKTSKLLGTLTGLAIPRNKPIVGKNAFAHESGVHQDGVIKSALTYEIMTPDSVGVPQSSIVLGKHSGKHGLRARCEAIGFKLGEDELKEVYNKFIDLADKKKEVTDEDLVAIVEDVLDLVEQVYQLEYLQTTSGSNTKATATVQLKSNSNSVLDSNVGDGPVDATYKTIERITGITGRLLEYSINAVTIGKDAMGEAFVKVRFQDDTVAGHGLSTDVIEASAKAYLNALNKWLSLGKRK
ncbi:MAG: 2-isopropylmalate synthase [Candidatus Abyssobacteria bacterium SURF_17]|uniref:2-isopropylmalate synthase n=1 Tax=Candidatus Abyssobacteria bacterium SURF_17 TaxID=2093361 RepID=A0A419EUP4_9BACT|nr:MAG: 2-isopropylmalate synthase [Candidatus Abyssubacteria bacterium SURF_17]